MNYNLKNTPLERLCIIDIETVRGKKTITSSDPEFFFFREKYKDKDTLEYQSDEKVLEKYLKNAPLKAIYGKIVCISLAYYNFEAENIRTVSFYNMEEEDIIKGAIEIIAKNKLLVAGHNIIGFDLPYIRQRFHLLGMHYSMDYLTSANDSGAKPWDLEKNVLDTMAIWKGTSFENTGLSELCFAFGLLDPKFEISGAKVSELYYNGEYDKIAKYCEGDVSAVANLILIWLGQDPMNSLSTTFNTLTSPYPDGVSEEVEDANNVSFAEMPIVQALKVSTEIDQDLEDRVIEYLGEVCEEDLDSLKALLLSIYSKPMSRKAEKEAYEIEIDEIINNLNIVECES